MSNTNNKFLDATGLTYLISKIKTADNANINKIYVGSCSTTASSQNKVATTETFPTVAYNDNGTTKYKPVTGTVVAIKYSVSNTCKLANITLNVNNTGAWPFYYNNAQLAEVSTANTAVAGYKNRYIYYMFNGTQWAWLTGSYDANSTYSAMTQAEIDAGTGTTGRTMTPARLRDNFYTEDEVDALLSKKISAVELYPVIVYLGMEEATSEATAVEMGEEVASLWTEISNTYGGEDGGTLHTLLNTPAHKEDYGDSNTYGWTLYGFPFGGNCTYRFQVNWIDDNGTLKYYLTGPFTKILATQNDLASKANTSDLATVATSGDYDDLSNKPTIPTVPTFKTINSEAITGSGDISVQAPLTFDSTPTANSNNVVKSGGVYSALQGKKNAESTDMLLYFGLTKAALISALNGSSEDNPVTLSGTALEKWNELIADVTDEKRTWTYAFQPVAVNYNDASNRGVTFMGSVISNNQEPILWEFHKDGNNYWMTRTTVSYAKTSDLTSKQDTLTWATTSDIDDMMLEEVEIDEPDPGIEIEE